MNPHPLVVLGASAGGIEPLVDVVAGLPTDLPAAVLVTVHTGERPNRALPRILQRAGTLPAVSASDGEPVEPGRIYVAPADRHLLLRQGHVVLSTGPTVNRHRPAVDAMFVAAARAGGAGVVAVVLSGVLDDGAVGAALVARAGGKVVVQDPADAQFGSMPRAALLAVPDAWAAPARDLGRLVTKLVRDLPEGGETVPEDSASTDPSAMAESADPGFLRPDEATNTRMSCPECKGGLARIDLPHIGFFRCHVGHQYSARSLEAAQREAAEATLWSAVASLEEHAALARSLAGDDALDPAYEDAARHSAELARAVRERLIGDR